MQETDGRGRHEDRDGLYVLGQVNACAAFLSVSLNSSFMESIILASLRNTVILPRIRVIWPPPPNGPTRPWAGAPRFLWPAAARILWLPHQPNKHSWQHAEITCLQFECCPFNCRVTVNKILPIGAEQTAAVHG